MLIDVANSLVDQDLPVPSYRVIYEIPATVPIPSHIPESLAHSDFYMDDVISAVQGGHISNTESLMA